MRKCGDWLSEELKDMLDVPFKVGDKVARAYTSGHASNIELCEVTRIDNGKMYLDNSKRAINFPGRLLIVNKVFVFD